MSEGSLTSSMARFVLVYVFVVRGGGVGGGGGVKGFGCGIIIVDFFGGVVGMLDDGWFFLCVLFDGGVASVGESFVFNVGNFFNCDF